MLSWLYSMVEDIIVDIMKTRQCIKDIEFLSLKMIFFYFKCINIFRIFVHNINCGFVKEYPQSIIWV